MPSKTHEDNGISQSKCVIILSTLNPVKLITALELSLSKTREIASESLRARRNIANSTPNKPDTFIKINRS